MGRPRKLEQLTRPLSARIRTEQDVWLRFQADQRFEGELSRAVRWAIDQAEVLTALLNDSDPVQAMDEMFLKPEVPPPLVGAHPLFLGNGGEVPEDELAAPEELG